MNKQQLLKKATEAVTDRGEAYGATKRNFQEIADYWTLHLRNRYQCELVLSPEDVAAMMVLMKVARLDHTPDHEDSMVDIAGYAACWADLNDPVQPGLAPFPPLAEPSKPNMEKQWFDPKIT